MSLEEAKDLLILIYLEIKFRKKNELLIINEDIINKEKQSLRKYSIFTITKYIYDYINILVDTKAEEKFNQRKKLLIEINNNSPLEYEKLLIKAERDLREHVKFEEQLKIRVEELEFELDDIKTGKIKNNNITYKSILTMTNESEKKDKKNKKLIHKKNEKYSKKLLQNISNNIFNTIDSNSKTKKNIMHKNKFSRILSIKKNPLSHKSNIMLSNNFYIFSNNNTNNNISQKNSFLKFKSLINSTKKNKKTLKKISNESISISYSNNKNQKLTKYYSKFRKKPNLTNLMNNNKLNIFKIINTLKIKCKKINSLSNYATNNYSNKKYNVQKTFQTFYNPHKIKNIINMKKTKIDKKSKSNSKYKYNNICKTERLEDSSQYFNSKPKNNNQITQNNTYCKTSMISDDIYRTGDSISKIGNSKEKSSAKKRFNNNIKLKKRLIYGRLIKNKKSFRSNTNYLLTEYNNKKTDK